MSDSILPPPTNDQSFQVLVEIRNLLLDIKDTLHRLADEKHDEMVARQRPFGEQLGH